MDELQVWVNNLESINEKGTHLSQITDIEIRQIAFVVMPQIQVMEVI